MSSEFRTILHRYHVLKRASEKLRMVLEQRFGWDEAKQMETMRQVLTKRPLLPPAPPVGPFGRPPRKGQLF